MVYLLIAAVTWFARQEVERQIKVLSIIRQNLSQRVAFGLSLPSFVVAYGFAYNQALLMEASVLEIAGVVFTAACGTIAMAGATVSFLIDRTTRAEQLLLFVAAPMLIVPEIYTDIAGLVVLGAIIARQSRRVRARRVETAVAAT